MTLVYTSHQILAEIEDFELAELVRVDSIVSRSDDAGRSTGSLVLKSSGGYHLVNIDILRCALDVEDELQETVFNRSLLHLDHSSTVRTTVSAIDGKVSEVGSSRVDLRTCGVEVVNSLSVTAGEHGSTTCLRGSLLIFNNTVHNLVHIPLVVAELVAFDGFDTTIVAIGDEFETNEKVVFEEIQTLVDLNDLILDGINLILDHLFNLCLCGTISKFRLHISEIGLNLIKCLLEINELRRVVGNILGIISHALLVVSNTLFEHGHLLQSCDLVSAEEVLRFNSLEATFEGVDHRFLRIDAIAECLVSLNEIFSLFVASLFKCIHVTLNSLDLAKDVSNLVVEFSLVNLAVDERLQLSFRLFETLHLRFERCDVGESVLKRSNLSLNRCVGSIEISLLSVGIEIRLLSVVSELGFDLGSLLVGGIELTLQGGDLAIQVVLDRYEISLIGSDLFANGSKIIIVVLAGHERASRGCHNEQTEQCAINDFLVH